MTPLRALMVATMLLGCTSPKNPPPWRWMELGSGPLVEALEQGEWILADSELPDAWLAPDTTPAGQTLIRDLRTFGNVACGDRMRLDPADLPLSLRHQFGWAHQDSLTIQWWCMDQGELALHFQQQMRQRPFDKPALESEWVDLLRKRSPDWVSPGSATIVSGEALTLSISTTRADGIPLEPDTVTMTFSRGDREQVVPAIEAWLDQMPIGSRLHIWSTSELAFGSMAHDGLGLPAHMPLLFEVTVNGAPR